MRCVILGITLLSACASGQAHKPAVTQEKIILLGSEDEIKERCNGKVLARRNVNCIFTVGKDHITVLPRWYLDLQEGKTGQYYKDEAVKHAFLPVKDGFSFSDRLSGNLPFAFLKITPKQQDGVNMFSASVFVRKSDERKDTEDYTDEVWVLVDQALPTAVTGSPHVAKYIEDAKQAAAEQAKLEARKAYLDRFAEAKTMGQLNSFIRDYEGNDPDRFVPEARKKLERLEIEAKEASEREKLTALEDEISWCQKMIKQAQEIIDRENRIGVISGYVNTLRLHEAGAMIVSCKERINNDYIEYNRLGGAKVITASNKIEVGSSKTLADNKEQPYLSVTLDVVGFGSNGCQIDGTVKSFDDAKRWAQESKGWHNYYSVREVPEMIEFRYRDELLNADAIKVFYKDMATCKKYEKR
jgi:hypothetical protein